MHWRRALGDVTHWSYKRPAVQWEAYRLKFVVEATKLLPAVVTNGGSRISKLCIALKEFTTIATFGVALVTIRCLIVGIVLELNSTFGYLSERVKYTAATVIVWRLDTRDDIIRDARFWALLVSDGVEGSFTWSIRYWHCRTAITSRSILEGFENLHQYPRGSSSCYRFSLLRHSAFLSEVSGSCC